jgi:predicted deacylase
MSFFYRSPALFVLFLSVLINNAQATELADDEDIVVGVVEEKLTIEEAPAESAGNEGVLETSVEEAAKEAKQVPLQLLGEEVLPGKFMPLNWSPEQSFQSLNTPVPVLVAHGANRGPVMCLTAAIHGDELNGIEMIRRLIYQLDPEKMNGTVIGIPIVNLDGFRRGSRYLADRRDLNRHFPGSPKGSAADRMAYSLFHNVIRHCEYLVDLHTGSLKRTNLPQIRGDLGSETVFDFSRHFGGITVLHGVGAEGTLRRAAENIGIPAITLEAGGPNQLDKSSVDAGLKALETLLQNLGIQPTLRFWGSPQPVFYQSHWIRADQSGILISSVELGDKVKKGDVLGIVTDPMTNTGTKIIATFNGRILGMAFNQVVQTGFAAYHVGVEKEPEAVKEEVLIEGEKIDKPEALLESKIEQE